MAFGFIGDIVEQIGETILPRGTRGATIGAALGGPTGAALGARLSADIATGSPGQEAVSSPTAQQAPALAPESALSGGGVGPRVYQPSFRAYEGRYPIEARVGLPSGQVSDIAAGAAIGGAMDMMADINISKFFGADSCAQKMKRLVSVNKEGCPYVTRKQQATLRKMLMYLPIEEVAYSAGVDTDTLARLVSKQFAPRRRGISSADMRTANRVNNKLIRGVRKLGYNVTPMTKAELNKMGC